MGEREKRGKKNVGEGKTRRGRRKKNMNGGMEEKKGSEKKMGCL